MVHETAKHEKTVKIKDKKDFSMIKNTSAWYRQDGHHQKCWRQLACSSLLPPLSLPTENHVKRHSSNFKAK
jgi:hypothetical protein